MSENGNRSNGEGPRDPRGDRSADWQNEWHQFVEDYRSTSKRKPRDVQPKDTNPKGKTGYDWKAPAKTSELDKETLFGLFASDSATEIVNLLISKQADYGPNSVQNAPYGPVEGLITRLHDKLSRAANLTSNGKKNNHESLRETFLDIAGYGIIALMVLDGKFPQAKK